MLCVSCANGSDKFVNLGRILDAFGRLHARAHINRQRVAVMTQRANAIGHVGSVESTRQDEVSVDVWRKRSPIECFAATAVTVDMGVEQHRLGV